MIGSGENNVAQVGAQAAAQNAQPAGPALPTPALIANPFTKSGTSTNVNIDGANLPEGGANYLWGQLASDGLGMIGQAFVSYWNYQLQSDAQANALNLGRRYYESMDHQVTAQKECIIKSLDIQDKALTLQKDMHKDQIKHEREIVKLQNSLAVKLSSISEAGKTDRARIMAVNNAFNPRNDYFMGKVA